MWLAESLHFIAGQKLPRQPMSLKKKNKICSEDVFSC